MPSSAQVEAKNTCACEIYEVWYWTCAKLARKFPVMNQSNPIPISVDVDEAARLTSLSPFQVRNLINDRTIPARKQGTRVLVDYAGLLAWFESLPLAGKGEQAS
jgi:excisionase family DNA binding protein